MSAFDAEGYRTASHEAWDAAAPGWRRNRALMAGFGEPVSRWMVEAIEPRPGQRVLELAAGIADTGLLAAQGVEPGGSVVISDQSEAMLDGARQRAGELGVENAEFRALNAEWIDFPLASFDAVLCRWGLMLLADPGAALGEMRRVLRPGGRLALAVWDRVEHNPWSSIASSVLRERGIGEQAPPEGWRPGPFALGDPQRVLELLGDAGFTEAHVEPLELLRRHASFGEFWETQLDLSPFLHDAIMSLSEPEIEQVRAAVEEGMAPYTAPDGSLAIPGRALGAKAEA
jgi:SAM-dependent methyltransferase